MNILLDDVVGRISGGPVSNHDLIATVLLIVDGIKGPSDLFVEGIVVSGKDNAHKVLLSILQAIFLF